MPRNRLAPRPPLAGTLACAALALALGACQTMLAHHLGAPTTATHREPRSKVLTEDFEMLERWLTAEPQEQSQMLAAAESAYQSSPQARTGLRLALLLGTPGVSGADPARARSILQGLMNDPNSKLLPQENTLARLYLSQITNQLTLSSENRTLEASGAKQFASLNRQLQSATAQNVALKRQLEQARAKLAAIANIEKSLNEGKLGNQGPPQ